MQKQYDTLPTGLPEWDGTGIDDFDLPDYMFKDPIHYSEEWFNFIEEKVKDENLADEYKQIMINIMHKKHGVDVRLSLTIFIYIIAHGFTITVNEFKNLTEKIINKMEELELGYHDLIDEWKNTLAGVTVDDEVINARIELRGFVYKTLKERLDAMQAIDDKLNPVSEVFSIEHNQNCYPVVRVLAFENGLGIGPLGVNLGGSNTITVNCDTEYMGRNSLKVKVPLAFVMTNPTTERISANEYLLVEGIKSLIVEVGTKAEANVETFITKEIESDFTGKIAGSNVENGNKLKALNGTTLYPPDSQYWVEAGQYIYDLVKKLDGEVYTGSTVINNQIRQMSIPYDVLFILEQNFPLIFKRAASIAEKVAIAKRIYVGNVLSVWGKGSGPSGNLLQMKVLNASGTWSSVTAKNTTNTIKAISSSSLDANRITNDGKLHVLVNAEASNGTTPSVISIDYAKITITARVPFSKI
ncbi:MAG: hypothetical protein ACTIDE_01600 [Carnobacterium maltaromaticum]